MKRSLLLPLVLAAGIGTGACTYKNTIKSGDIKEENLLQGLQTKSLQSDISRYYNAWLKEDAQATWKTSSERLRNGYDDNFEKYRRVFEQFSAGTRLTGFKIMKVDPEGDASTRVVSYVQARYKKDATNWANIESLNRTRWVYENGHWLFDAELPDTLSK